MPDNDDHSSAAVLDAALNRVADQYGPAAQPAFTELLSRRRRRTRLRAGASAAVGVAAVAALTLGPGLPFLGSSVEPGSTAPDQARGPLVPSGECASLTVTALWQGTPDRTPLSIGPDAAANVVTMTANSLLYVEADGPCIDRLRLDTDSALVRGTSSTALNSFDPTGLSAVIAVPGPGGRATIDLYLDGTPDPIAQLTIEITPSAPASTEQPDGPEHDDATWTLAATPAPTDTTVPLLVEETACASGQSADGRIVSNVEYTPTQIVVDISIQTRPGDQDCPDNPQTPYDLKLTEPVGDRAVVPAD